MGLWTSGDRIPRQPLPQFAPAPRLPYSARGQHAGQTQQRPNAHSPTPRSLANTPPQRPRPTELMHARPESQTPTREAPRDRHRKRSGDRDTPAPTHRAQYSIILPERETGRGAGAGARCTTPRFPVPGIPRRVVRTLFPALCALVPPPVLLIRAPPRSGHRGGMQGPARNRPRARTKRGEYSRCPRAACARARWGLTPRLLSCTTARPVQRALRALRPCRGPVCGCGTPPLPTRRTRKYPPAIIAAARCLTPLWLHTLWHTGK